MNNLMQAATDVRALLRGFQAAEQVAAALDKAGSAVQALEEATSSLVSVNAEVAAAKAALAGALGDVEEAKAEANRARINAQQVTEQAQQVAVKFVADAEERAKKVDYDAQAAHDRLLADNNAQLQAVVDQRAAVQADLDAAEGKLAAVREQINKLLG